jgi:hypothetical protein
VDLPAGEEAEGGPRPVAAVATKASRHTAVQGSSESTECVGSQASRGTVGEPRGNNSSDQSVELAGALPPVPKGQSQVRKRKTQEVESSRYGQHPLAVFLLCHPDLNPKGWRQAPLTPRQ